MIDNIFFIKIKKHQKITHPMLYKIIFVNLVAIGIVESDSDAVI